MKEKVDLIFKDGDKSKDLLTVVITSEKFEGLQAKMFFSQKGPKKNETFLLYFKWIGDYIPKGDLNWIPQRFFKPAIRQARAIFTKYRHKKNTNQAR